MCLLFCMFCTSAVFCIKVLLWLCASNGASIVCTEFLLCLWNGSVSVGSVQARFYWACFLHQIFFSGRLSSHQGRTRLNRPDEEKNAVPYRQSVHLMHAFVSVRPPIGPGPVCLCVICFLSDQNHKSSMFYYTFERMSPQHRSWG